MKKFIILIISTLISISVYLNVDIYVCHNPIFLPNGKELSIGLIMKTNTKNANIRANGNLNAPIITNLEMGTILIYEGEVSRKKFRATIDNVNHYEPYLKVRIQASGQSGWIYKASLTSADLSQNEDNYDSITYYVTANSLNIRIGPSTDHGILKTLNHGTPLHHNYKISDHKDRIKINRKWHYDHWYYVEVFQIGISGWVYGGGISLHPTKLNNYPTPKKEHRKQQYYEDEVDLDNLPNGYYYNKEIGEVQRRAKYQYPEGHQISQNQIDIEFTGNLKYRKPVSIPLLSRPPSFVGKITMKVCINNEGNVEHAKYNHRKSDDPSNEVVNSIKQSIGHFAFKPSSKDYQCGEIIFTFLPESNK